MKHANGPVGFGLVGTLFFLTWRIVGSLDPAAAGQFRPSIPLVGAEDKADRSSTGAIILHHTKAQTDAIVAALSSENPQEVLAALENAKGILRKDFKERIGACLSHEDRDVRTIAREFILPCGITAEYPRLARALSGQFPGPLDEGGCVPESETDLRDPHGPMVRQFELLGSAAIPVLLKALKSEVPTTRIVAINLLGKTASPRVVPALKDRLSDPDPSVRQRAARALGHVGGKEVLDALYILRDQAGYQLVRAVAIALSQHEDERALPIWQDLMKQDQGDYIGYVAPGWICRFPHQKAIPILIDGMGYSQDYIRRGCLDALKRLTRKDFGANPGLWKKWWRSAKKKEMFEILGEALDAEQSNDALMDLVNEGDTRAIPFVLRNYGKVRMTHGFCNERVDSNWALRILSGHSFAVETDHDGPPDRDDAGQLPLWRKWLAENRAALPRRCSLIDPFRPAKEIARIPIAACAEHISVDRHLLFVGGRTYLEVFDISDVTRPERIGEYRVDEQGVEQIAATAGRLFLTTHAGTLHVYGYTDQGDLRLISTHSEVRYGAHFMVSARRLLVSNHLYQRNAQAALYDLTGSGAPRLLHVCDASTLQPFSFSGENGFYTTARWDADRISTEGCFPMATVQRSVWPNGAVTADDRWFYCLDHGLLVIRDLRTGRLLGTAPARAPYDGTICVRDKRVFALLESMGMVVYDVFEPSNPKVLSHTPLPGQPGKIYRGLSISGDYLFCANYEGDLLIFEFPEPLKKREME